MKRKHIMFNRVRRLLLRCQIWALDTHIDNLTRLLGVTLDDEHRRRVESRRFSARLDLNRLHVRHDALLPISQRRVWPA